MLTTASLAVSRQMLHSNTESSFFSSPPSSVASSRLILDLPVGLVSELPVSDSCWFVVVVASALDDVTSEYRLAVDCCEVDAEFRSSKLGAEGCGGALSTVDAMAVWIFVKLFAKHLSKLVRFS